MDWQLGIGELIALAGFIVANLLGLVGLWTKVNVTLKGLEFRVSLMEKNQECDRGDIKALTAELHQLCVTIARQMGDGNQ